MLRGARGSGSTTGMPQGVQGEGCSESGIVQGPGVGGYTTEKLQEGEGEGAAAGLLEGPRVNGRATGMPQGVQGEGPAGGALPRGHLKQAKVQRGEGQGGSSTEGPPLQLLALSAGPPGRL